MEVLATNPDSRITAVKSGKRLEYFTIVWLLLEGGILVLEGVVLGSTASLSLSPEWHFCGG
jgi:hypothetical protein